MNSQTKKLRKHIVPPVKTFDSNRAQINRAALVVLNTALDTCCSTYNIDHKGVLGEFLRTKKVLMEDMWTNTRFSLEIILVFLIAQLQSAIIGDFWTQHVHEFLHVLASLIRQRSSLVSRMVMGFHYASRSMRMILPRYGVISMIHMPLKRVDVREKLVDVWKKLLDKLVDVRKNHLFWSNLKKHSTGLSDVPKQHHLDIVKFDRSFIDSFTFVCYESNFHYHMRRIMQTKLCAFVRPPKEV